MSTCIVDSMNEWEGLFIFNAYHIKSGAGIIGIIKEIQEPSTFYTFISSLSCINVI